MSSARPDSAPTPEAVSTELVHDPIYGIVAIRYVPTYINKDGMRTLMFAQQGRNTFATPEDAQASMDAIVNNTHTTPDALRQIWGNDPRFEVRRCRCWPGRFDPCGIFFDD